MLTSVVFCVVCEVISSATVWGAHTYTYIDRTVSLTIQHAASNQASITINKSDDRNNQSVLINKTVCFHSDSADSELSLFHWDRAGAQTDVIPHVSLQRKGADLKSGKSLTSDTKIRQNSK